MSWRRHIQGIGWLAILSVLTGHVGAVGAGPDGSELTASMPRYIARGWQSDEGLPHNVVQALAQTPDGYLWVGTREGLARFDGVRFTVFDTDNTPQFAHPSISALCVDHEGTLWIGTWDGLIRYRDGKFSRFTSKDGLAGNDLSSICETADGALWIASMTGLTCYKDGKFTRYGKNEGLVSDIVRAVCTDGQDGVWIATPFGLNHLDGKKIETYTTGNGLPDNALRGVALDKSGRLWIGCDHGLICYTGGKFYNYGVHQGLSDNLVTAICEDRQGNLWVGTYSGLNRFREGHFFDEPDSDGTPYDKVNALFENRDGSFWIGSRGGLTRLTPKRFFSIAKKQGLTHNNVMSVREDRSGRLCVATWGGGLNLIKDEQITAYSATNGLTHDMTLSTCETSDGSLWIGADYDGGLTHWKDGNFTHYTWRDGLINSSVRVIHEDKAGNLWIGTGRGLSCLRDGKFTNYTTKQNLAGDIVRCIDEDTDGALWIGTETGLSRMTDGHFVNFTKKEGLAGDSVLDFYKDKAGDLWIATGNGLTRYRDGKFTSYTSQQGLFSDLILAVLKDDNGRLWMSSTKGIFRVRKADFDAVDEGKARAVMSVAYGKSDGLENALFNGVAQPAAWKARDGKLWFPTTKGLVGVDPRIESETPPPPVFIEELVADGKPSLHNGQNLAAARQDAPLRIAPGRGELEFRYTALSYQAPEKSHFKYMLEGVDLDWIDAKESRVAHYNNIYPGNYMFRVIACNGDGVWNSAGASMGVMLLPHFWQTKSFMVAVVLCSIALVGGVARFVTQARLQRKLELLRQQHAVERERGRIAKDIHDELGSSLTRIMLLGQRAQEDVANPSELATHAKRIVASARTTVQSLDEIVWAVDPKKDTLDGLIGYINQYANQFFEGAHVRCRLEMPVNSSSLTLPAEVRHNLFLVVKEALNNVLKHSHAKEVRVRLTETDGAVEIAIEDNGRGFSAGNVNCVRKGNGLDNMRKRVEGLGGIFSLTSMPGQGTSLKITVKMDSSAAKT